jgi:hypothetical protein
MADVTGFIGGEAVELNNAATEATLKQLVQAIAVLSAKQGGAKSPEKIAKEMDKFYKAMAEANKNQEKENKLKQKANDLQEKDNKLKEAEIKLEKSRQQALTAGLNSFVDTINKANSAFMGLLTDLSNMGNDLNAVSGVLKQIPLIGGVMGTAFGAVAGAATKTYKAFNTAASVGATFGGSIQEMQKSVAGTGLTLDQYTNLIKNNSDALSIFGGGIANGTKRFTQMSKQLVGSNLGNELARLGYTTEDINGSLIRYSAQAAKASGGRAMSDQELIKSTGQYLKDLDAVAKLTGKSKESLEKEEEARQADAQYRILQAKVGKEGTDNLKMLMNSMSKSEQQAAQSILATGTLSNEAAQQLMITNPQAAKALLQASKDIKQSGTLTREGAFKIDDAFNAGAIASKNNAAQMVLGTHESEKYSDGIVSNLNRATRSEQENASLRKSAAQTEADAAKKLAEGLKPEDMKNNMEKLATASNKFLEALANSPLLEKMITWFTSALATVTPMLLSTFDFIGEHGKALVTVFGLVTATTLLLNTATKLALLQKAAERLELGLLSKAFKFLGVGVRGLLGPIGLAITAALLLYENWDFVSNGFLDILDTIRSYLPSWAGGISKDEAQRRKDQRALAQSTKDLTKANEDNAKQKETFAPGAPAAIGTGKPVEMSSYMKAIAQIESGGNANAKSGTSSAAGLFQFTEGTWKDMTKEMGKNYTSQDRFDPAKSAEVMEYFTKKNKGQLEKGIGRQASSTDMYMSHFLGAGGATKFLNGMSTNQDASAAQMMGQQAASANKNIFYDKNGRERSLKEVYELMGQKVAKAEGQVGGGTTSMAAAVPSAPGQVSPTATAAQTALAKPAATPTNASMPSNPLDALQKGLANQNQASLGGPAPAGPASQENPTTLLSSLNMKMDQLIRIQSGAKETGEKQLKKTASGGANMDMFTNVSIV